eukprot:scaffold184620_cov33-Tisochrysis_lutea.AAC.3
MAQMLACRTCVGVGANLTLSEATRSAYTPSAKLGIYLSQPHLMVHSCPHPKFRAGMGLACRL